jgi:hypothetical protein
MSAGASPAAKTRRSMPVGKLTMFAEKVTVFKTEAATGVGKLAVCAGRAGQWKTVSCLRYRQSDDISSPKKNNRMIKPLTTVPAMAAIRFIFLSQATTLTISAIGGVSSIASPPRAVRGEPHPGCSRAINAIVTGATSDKPRPIRPVFACDWFSRGGS